ncbi:hypothetical protein NDR87_24945 [Nocardia sp. CDC159]|uniref:Large secreted protein n=1 Tax=Nocardia pulmonis TaxID=2951408 RepID=A0A9X2IZP3_9NOCA|nr:MULTISPECIES: hypothetical protein [Nocardia]MCM6775151.1 hypothetical protein [Nocardia pulmonis]MCM6789621.1 hypothetical protein [Nocardia sp. CDC159]
MKPISGSRRAVAAAATLLTLLVAGCGQANNDGAQGNTSANPTSTPSTPTEQTTPQPGRAFTANPAIVNSRPVPFDSWTRVAPDRIAVNFQIGSPECYGVDASTNETDSTVTVELRAGTLPEAVGRMCTMIAVFGTLEITLKQPLGNRKVLSAR